MTEFDSTALRRAFGSFMTGVTVVTTRTESGALVGFTANSFTSVSLNPPLLLVCPGKHLSSFEAFNSATHFAVNVLAEGQESVSNTFAASSGDRFAVTPWHADRLGSPLIEGCAATFSCRVHQRHDAGDHIVLLGEVMSFEKSEQNGLGYCLNGYFNLSQEQDSNASSTADRTGIAGAIIVHDDDVLLVEDGQGRYRLPSVKQIGAIGARRMLQEYLDSQVLDAELGPVYSAYNDEANRTHFTFFRARAKSGRASGIGSFKPIASLRAEQFSDYAESSMMMRFITEHGTQLFGLFLGSTDTGEVHVTRDEQD